METVSNYLSNRNTIALFRRFHVDFGVSCAPAHKRMKSDAHAYRDPFKKKTAPSDKVVGEFMIAV